MDPQKIREFLASKSVATDAIDGVISLINAQAPETAGKVASLQTELAGAREKSQDLESKLSAAYKSLAEATDRIKALEEATKP